MTTIKNGTEKRIFRLEVLMYLILLKESLIPNISIPNLVVSTWRTLF